MKRQMARYSSIKAAYDLPDSMRFQDRKMDKSKMFNFAEFCQSNKNKDVMGYDFVRAVYKSANLPGDFLIWFVKLVWPELKEVNGRIYVSDLYSDEQYGQLISGGRTEEQVQFWMNLLQINGLFDDMDGDQVELLAKKIAECWTAKIRQEFGAGRQEARVIVDEETEEVFVVIGQPN